MPKQPPTLGTLDQSGIPRIGRDDPSMNDLVVWQLIDSHTFNGGKLPNYGDPYPGFVNPNDGGTIYSDFVCIDRQPTEDNRYWNVAWQGLPGTMLYERQMSEEAQGAFVTVRRQFMAHGTAQQGLMPNTVGYDDKDVDPGRIFRTSIIADAFPVKYEYFYDNERGNVIRTRQLIPITGSEVATDVLVGSTAIKTYFQPYDKNLLLNWRLIESFNLPGPDLGIHETHPDCQMAIAVGNDTIIDVSSGLPSLTYLDLEYKDQQIDAVTMRRHLLTASFFPLLIGYERDPFKNNRLIITEVQVVDSSTAFPGASPGVEVILMFQDEWRSILKIKTYETPSAYSEFRHGAVEMPALFNNSNPTMPASYAWSDACGAFGKIRSRQPMMTNSRVYHEWFNTIPSAQTLLDILPQTLILGRGWQFTSPMLCDSGTFTYSGSCTAAFPISASSPSYSTYVGSIQGTEQRISEECVLDNGGLWHRQTLYQYMR